MGSISIPAALAAGSIASSIAGSAMQSDAAGNAADAQSRSAANATAAQLQMYNQSRGDLAPYNAVGQAELGELARAHYLYDGSGNYQAPAAWNPTMAGLAATPGYQFTLQQGLRGVQNAQTAQGLGVSGSAMRAGADYASGLASNTYNQQFQNYLNAAQNNINQFQAGFSADTSNKQNVFNRLFNLAQLGANAANGQATNAIQTGAQVGSNMIGAGNAQAAGMIGSANAVSGGLNNALGGLSQAAIYNSLFNNSNAGATAAKSAYQPGGYASVDSSMFSG